MKNRPTATIVVKYELKDCSKCPMVISKRTVGAGYALDYHCSAVDNKRVMYYVEWDKDMNPVPEWCPYRIEKIYRL